MKVYPRSPRRVGGQDVNCPPSTQTIECYQCRGWFAPRKPDVCCPRCEAFFNLVQMKCEAERGPQRVLPFPLFPQRRKRRDYGVAELNQAA